MESECLSFNFQSNFEKFSTLRKVIVLIVASYVESVAVLYISGYFAAVALSTKDPVHLRYKNRIRSLGVLEIGK